MTKVMNSPSVVNSLNTMAKHPFILTSVAIVNSPPEF